MSRWTQQFETAPFQESFNSITELIETLSTVELSNDVNQVEELLRLKKVVEYFSNILNKIDPELCTGNIVNIYQNLHTHLSRCFSELSAYSSSYNILNLTNANTHFDNALSLIKSLYVVPIGKRSMTDTVLAYTRTINQHIASVADTKSILDSANNLLAETKTIHNRMKETEEEIGLIRDEISETQSIANKQYGKINEFYNETLVSDEEDNRPSTKEELIDAKKAILKDVEEAHEKLINMTNKLDELEKFYVKIFGELDEGNENRIGGLNQESVRLRNEFEDFIKNSKEQENTFINESNDKFDTLFEKIEGLLPGATRTGLAKSFVDLRSEFAPEVKQWTNVFAFTVLLMFIVGFTVNYSAKDPQEFLKNTLLFSPIFFPLIWLASFASKRRSENKRLEQEYAHKEAVALSFENYKKQISDLKDENQDLMYKLLEHSIDAVAFNASSTLDKKHGDKTPYHEIISATVKEVSGKIPSIKIDAK